jgi:hypothetical protein
MYVRLGDHWPQRLLRSASWHESQAPTCFKLGSLMKTAFPARLLVKRLQARLP